MNKRAHLLIAGRVQGVWFRASTKEQADRLGLSGWVRNRRAGEVEVVAEGAAPALEALIEWCRIGPRGASVAEVEVEYEAYRGEFGSFEIVGSA